MGWPSPPGNPCAPPLLAWLRRTPNPEFPTPFSAAAPSLLRSPSLRFNLCPSACSVSLSTPLPPLPFLSMISDRQLQPSPSRLSNSQAGDGRNLASSRINEEKAESRGDQHKHKAMGRQLTPEVTLDSSDAQAIEATP